MTCASNPTLAELLPKHRLYVIAKTPLLIFFGLYLAGGRLHFATSGLTLLLASVLWAMLYIFNETTDLALEQGRPVRKSLAFALLAVVVLLCLASTLLWPRIGLFYFGMVCSQLLYCLRPWRLKRWWWGPLLLSGFVNPILRLECGIAWGQHPVSLLIYGTFIALHLGPAIRARALLRARDQSFGYHPLPRNAEIAGVIFNVLGAIGMYSLCYTGALPSSFYVYTTVGVLFSVYAWSNRASDLTTLRKAWVGFAIVTIVIIIGTVYFQR